ncbi:MAG: hypothetical protein ABIZ72_04320 [Candidatus Limnocylindrales bacterium]
MAGGSALRPARAIVAAVMLAIATGCGPAANDMPAVALPPDSATPLDVLQAYLGAMRNGDCGIAHQLFVQPARAGNGDLCGHVTLFSYRLTGDPLISGETEIVYGTTLTTGGSSDGSIPFGDYPWAYDLVRQPNGAWRIVSAGQG